MRMPRIFIILTILYFILYFIGTSLIYDPTEQELKELTVEKDKEVLLETDEKTNQEDHGLGPCQVILHYKFWQIWITLLVNTIVNMFVSTYYKVNYHFIY